jgi:hypothetical protein
MGWQSRLQADQGLIQGLRAVLLWLLQLRQLSL